MCTNIGRQIDRGLKASLEVHKQCIVTSLFYACGILNISINTTVLYYCIGVRVLYGSINICFDPVGSSSGNHYMNMSSVIGLFAERDPDQ
jgi:hypothetical protein